MRDPVALCADAAAGWHSAWLTALGLRSGADAAAWRALDRPPHIYFSAITLRPDTPAEAVGIFGVTTIASVRRRGYGSALTRAAMLVDSGLPAILAPSPEGEGVYRRLGFERVGELRIWSRHT